MPRSRSYVLRLESRGRWYYRSSLNRVTLDFIEILLSRGESRMSHAIVCRQLVKTYEGKPPVEAVRGIDLAVGTGECFGLLGPNGAGKTTTIEMIEGLLRPTSGEIEVLGRSWHDHARDIQQRIGISLQETRLAEKLTTRETLAMFRSFYRRGVDPTDALARLSLQEKADTRVGKLSGGQKQRLAVACAIIGDPELLFLDEPTTGLDPQSRRELWEIIRGFGDQGRTVLLTTHYLEEAERLCDRVAIVDQGKVIAIGTPRELIASLGGDHVVEFSWSRGDAGGEAVFCDWSSLPAVSSARDEVDRVSLSVAEPHVAIPALVEFLTRRGGQLTSLTTRHASLEDVFLKLAGRRLSQEETK